MGDLLRSGVRWLGQALSGSCSSQVTYRRGSTAVTVSAVQSQRDYEQVDVNGFVVIATVMDFLIPAEGFALGDPVEGDQIVVGTTVYEVMSLGRDGAWRWSDPYQVMRRVHTKLVGG